MSDREIKRIQYPCAQLGDTASLVLKYLNKEDITALVGFDCEDSRRCRVGKEGPAGQWSFD